MMTPYQLTTIYVSQQKGNDNWPGFYPEPTDKNQGPLKTLEKALEHIAHMRSFGMEQPITIRLVDEEYCLTKPVVISEEMYGITIEAEKECVVSGGIRLENFVNDTFNGQDCFSAPIPDGIWFTDLYVDGLRADVTRYPENGTLEPLEVENNSIQLDASSSWFIAKKEDLEVIKTLKNFGDCYISYLHYWVDEHTPIKSYDLETGKIEFEYPSRFTIEPTHDRAALRYVIENVAEGFANPNEWYADREKGRVYYIPRNADQTPETLAAYAPVCSQLFLVEGKPEKKARNINFRNLTFAYTKGEYCSKGLEPNGTDESEGGFASDPQSVCFAHGSVSFQYAENCEISDCTLRNLGVHGIDVKKGCHRIRIVNNKCYDLGAGGIKIDGGAAGSEVWEHTYGNEISDNLIYHCGRRYLCGCGILVKHSYENTISHNTIHDLYYTGISVGWVWGYQDSITRDNLIEANHIYHLGQGKLSDLGGIYLLGKQPGTVVRGNLIHDVTCAHYGGWGLYTDEGSSYITLENNICYNLNCNCFHQHYGSMNVVKNNIFVQSAECPVRMGRHEYHVGIMFERNIIVSHGTPIYQVGAFDWQIDGFAHVLFADGNLMFDTERETKVTRINDREYSLEEVRTELGLELSGMVADPLFVDMKQGDFTLKEESPAWKIGFRPIDMSQVGCRKENM
ncbi:MAG: right-handed parallel beta-helix repeat-containing protein [Ruminococcaceae bacterium]|nr:right-handed parallel beta-helix repeat-containing protein [Oscillospiraceae bacterium]